MKTCYTCKHLLKCRLDYDRAYPCKDYENDGDYKKKTSRGTQTDQIDEGGTAGGHDETLQDR